MSDWRSLTAVTSLLVIVSQPTVNMEDAIKEFYRMLKPVSTVLDEDDDEVSLKELMEVCGLPELR